METPGISPKIKDPASLFNKTENLDKLKNFEVFLGEELKQFFETKSSETVSKVDFLIFVSEIRSHYYRAVPQAESEKSDSHELLQIKNKLDSAYYSIIKTFDGKDHMRFSRNEIFNMLISDNPSAANSTPLPGAVPSTEAATSVSKVPESEPIADAKNAFFGDLDSINQIDKYALLGKLRVMLKYFHGDVSPNFLALTNQITALIQSLKHVYAFTPPESVKVSLNKEMGIFKIIEEITRALDPLQATTAVRSPEQQTRQEIVKDIVKNSLINLFKTREEEVKKSELLISIMAYSLKNPTYNNMQVANEIHTALSVSPKDEIKLEDLQNGGEILKMLYDAIQLKHPTTPPQPKSAEVQPTDSTTVFISLLIKTLLDPSGQNQNLSSERFSYGLLLKIVKDFSDFDKKAFEIYQSFYPQLTIGFSSFKIVLEKLGKINPPSEPITVARLVVLLNAQDLKIDLSVLNNLLNTPTPARTPRPTKVEPTRPSTAEAIPEVPKELYPEVVIWYVRIVNSKEILKNFEDFKDKLAKESLPESITALFQNLKTTVELLKPSGKSLDRDIVLGEFAKVYGTTVKEIEMILGIYATERNTAVTSVLRSLKASGISKDDLSKLPVDKGDIDNKLKFAITAAENTAATFHFKDRIFDKLNNLPTDSTKSKIDLVDALKRSFGFNEVILNTIMNDIFTEDAGNPVATAVPTENPSSAPAIAGTEPVIKAQPVTTQAPSTTENSDALLKLEKEKEVQTKLDMFKYFCLLIKSNLLSVKDYKLLSTRMSNYYLLLVTKFLQNAESYKLFTSIGPMFDKNPELETMLKTTLEKIQTDPEFNGKPGSTNFNLLTYFRGKLGVEEAKLNAIVEEVDAMPVVD